MRNRVILAGLLALLPAVSQAKTLEDLLVEKGIMTKGEAAATDSGGAAKVYYNESTRLEFPDTGFWTSMTTFVQPRYDFVDNDDGSENTSGFSVNAARLIVEGGAVHNEFSYFLQPDFSSNRNGKSPELLDATVTWHACDWLDVTMGQSKVAVSRQWNANDAKLQFTDRSIASEFFDLDRDNGLTLTWKGADNNLWMSAAVLNGLSSGEGRNGSSTVDTNHTGTLSLRYNPWGNMDVSEEGDVKWTEDHSFTVGATYAYSEGTLTPGPVTLGDFEFHALSADLGYKGWGWSFQGEFFWNAIDPEAVGPDLDEPEAMGFYAQAGWFFDPKKTELALGYSYIDCDDGRAISANSSANPNSVSCDGNDDVSAAAISLNHYWWDHHVKAQLGYRFLTESSANDAIDDVDTNQWTFQVTAYH